MTRRTPCSIGDVVAVTFDDHSEGSSHLVFTVFGRVMRKDPKTLLIGAFVYSDDDQIDENVTMYSILRSAIQKIEVLKKPQAPKDARGS